MTKTMVPPTASDLQRAWEVLGQTCSYIGMTEGAKLAERIAAELAAIRAKTKRDGWCEGYDAACEAIAFGKDSVEKVRVRVRAEGWEDAMKALRSVRPSLDNNQAHFWADWLAANRPSSTGRED